VPEESQRTRPVEGRVSTGNPGLDAMLEGGLVARRPYLIVGASGTGKTTLALQFLCEGVRRGERALLVTLEEPPNETRINHRALQPALDSVDVFDAIPDIMRYERAPFKDIAAVRSAVPFRSVSSEIRRTPELTSVEVTITALEQMLRTEVLRRNYTRVVIDSLTALQYFCMKGFDPVAGAQTFLRFLSDLQVTTLLTVESPLEDMDTPERMLARGEIRLFRWELEGMTVRAVGVEKFRGSSHDVRLHPYRIGPRGIDVNLDVTISRDTRQIIEAIVPIVEVRAAAPVPVEVTSVLDPLSEEIRDLIAAGADVSPVRTEVEAALGGAVSGVLDDARSHLTRATALTVGLATSLLSASTAGRPDRRDSREALRRIRERSETARAGVAPTELPDPVTLEGQLRRLLGIFESMPPPTAAAPAPPVAPPPAEPPSPPPAVAVPPPVAAPETVPKEPESPPPLPAMVTIPSSAPVAHKADRAPSRAPRVTSPVPAAPEGPPPSPSREAAMSPPATTTAPTPEPSARPLHPTPPAPPVPASVVEAPIAEKPAVPAKRRRAAAPRKKVAKSPPVTVPPVEPAPAATPAVAPAEVGVSAPAPPTTPEATPAAKPKRRVTRRRKAPPVVSTTVVPAPVPAPEAPPASSDPPPPAENSGPGVQG